MIYGVEPDGYWDDMSEAEQEAAEEAAAQEDEEDEGEKEEPHYTGDVNGYRTFSDGSYREDFHSDG